jgi:glycosyltransferase 2 family protein
VTKPAVKIALQYGLGFGLLVWVVWSNWRRYADDGTEVGLAVALSRPLDWTALTAAFLIYSTAAALTFVRWFVLVRAQDLPFTLGGAFRLGMIGLYFSAFLPGSVGGDIVKAVAIAREQSRRTVAVATVILDRVVGLCGLFWLVTLLGNAFGLTGMLPVLVQGDEALAILRGILLLCTTLSLGSLAFWIAMGFFPEPWLARMAERLERIPKIGHSIAELWRTVWLYRRRGAAVALAMGLAVLGHCGFVASFLFAALTVLPAGQCPSMAVHALIVPVGMVAQGIIPTPGGVGGAEAAFGALYGFMGYTVAAGVLAALVYRAISWVLGALGLVVYTRMRRGLPQAEKT